MARELIGADEDREGPLSLELRIERREGMSGTIGLRAERARLISFSGWLGLAEAIDVLRSEAGHPKPTPKQLGGAEEGRRSRPSAGSSRTSTPELGSQANSGAGSTGFSKGPSS
jgi:hypothetical protein